LFLLESTRCVASRDSSFRCSPPRCGGGVLTKPWEFSKLSVSINSSLYFVARPSSPPSSRLFCIRHPLILLFSSISSPWRLPPLANTCSAKTVSWSVDQLLTICFMLLEVLLWEGLIELCSFGICAVAVAISSMVLFEQFRLRGRVVSVPLGLGLLLVILFMTTNLMDCGYGQELNKAALQYNLPDVYMWVYLIHLSVISFIPCRDADSMSSLQVTSPIRALCRRSSISHLLHTQLTRRGAGQC